MKMLPPERVSKLLASCDAVREMSKGREHDFVVDADLLDLRVSEFRILLTAQRVAQAKTCQWRSAVGCWDTECGKSEHLRSANYCPNCGGLVTYD